MSRYHPRGALALLVATFFVGLAPVAAAPPIRETRENCGADVSVRLYADEAQTELVDEFTFGTVPAVEIVTFYRNRSVSELVVPPPGVPGVEVVGEITGAEYLFQLAVRFDSSSREQGASRSRASQSFRVSEPDGRMVSELNFDQTDIVVRGDVVSSTVHGRTRGLFLSSGWIIGCGSAIGVPGKVPGTFEDPDAAGDGGDLTYPLEAFYNGAFAATPRGLVPGITTALAVEQDPLQDFVPGGEGTTSFDIVVPAGTTLLRIATFDHETSGASDLDLYLYFDPDGENALFRASGGPSARELFLEHDPVPGTYRVWIHGYSVESPPATFLLSHWLVGSDDAGNMSVSAPSSVTVGGIYDVTLSFTGLAPNTAYVGTVSYTVFDGSDHPTVVYVTTPP